MGSLLRIGLVPCRNLWFIRRWSSDLPHLHSLLQRIQPSSPSLPLSIRRKSTRFSVKVELLGHNKLELQRPLQFILSFSRHSVQRRKERVQPFPCSFPDCFVAYYIISLDIQISLSADIDIWSEGRRRRWVAWHFIGQWLTLGFA